MVTTEHSGTKKSTGNINSKFAISKCELLAKPQIFVFITFLSNQELKNNKEHETKKFERSNSKYLTKSHVQRIWSKFSSTFRQRMQHNDPTNKKTSSRVDLECHLCKTFHVKNLTFCGVFTLQRAERQAH